MTKRGKSLKAEVVYDYGELGKIIYLENVVRHIFLNNDKKGQIYEVEWKGVD